MSWRPPFPRIRLSSLLETVEPSELARAQELAAKHEPPVFDRLTFTEARPEWVLLRLHASRGQIRPDVLKRMKTVDLEYLAGMPQLNPLQQATTAQWASEIKVVENAVRAERVLRHRSTFRVTIWATLLATLIGATVGGLIVKVGSEPSCELRSDPTTQVVTASC